MSIAYKKNGVWVTASGTPPIDDALSATSENPVQNKIVKQAIDGNKPLPIVISSINSLPIRYPTSGTDSRITSDMTVIESYLSSPSAQTSEWTVNTYEGYLQVTGSISGTTSLTIKLQKEQTTS